MNCRRKIDQNIIKDSHKGWRILLLILEMNTIGWLITIHLQYLQALKTAISTLERKKMHIVLV